MKAWLGYRDTISFEDINKKNPVLDKPRESLEQIKEEFGGLLLNSDQQY